MYWFDLVDPIESYEPQNFPVYIWEQPGRDQGIYGFPAIDGPTGGIKLATEQHLIRTEADNVDRAVTQADIDEMYEKHVKAFLPGLSQKCVKAVTCLYTVTPDSGFIIDWHPEHHNILLASPCSGHGFKHSAAIGEVLAQMATEGKSKIDISALSLARFSS